MQSPHGSASPTTTEGHPIGKNTPVRRVNQTALGLKDYLWLTSPAKINLHLETGAIRPDGYHEIRSIFCAVDLYDTIGFCLCTLEEWMGEGIRVDGNLDLPQKHNLMYKAAKAYRDRYVEKGNEVFGLRVIYEKNIPTGAGLGGGSSNAATTLLALQELLGHPLKFTELVELGASLGADIPFFLYNTPLALVEGIGEKVTPIQREKPLSIEVSPQPEIYSSTVGAYTALDKLYPKGRSFTFTPEELATMIQQAPSAWKFFNIFQQVPEIMTPQVVAALAKLHKIHNFAALSGSGSAVFGVS